MPRSSTTWTGCGPWPRAWLAGNQATYYEFTPTVTYKVVDGLFWRNEYRHDESDSKKVFPRENLFVRGQDTLATEIVYTF